MYSGNVTCCVKWDFKIENNWIRQHINQLINRFFMFWKWYFLFYLRRVFPTSIVCCVWGAGVLKSIVMSDLKCNFCVKMLPLLEENCLLLNLLLLFHYQSICSIHSFVCCDVWRLFSIISLLTMRIEIENWGNWENWKARVFDLRALVFVPQVDAFERLRADDVRARFVRRTISLQIARHRRLTPLRPVHCWRKWQMLPLEPGRKEIAFSMYFSLW